MKIVSYLCGAMLLATLAAGVWRWAEYGLTSAYKRPLPKQLLAGKAPEDGQVIGGDGTVAITFTINLSNLSKAAATNLWPRAAIQEDARSKFDGRRSEPRTILVGEYSEFASAKQKQDSFYLRIAISLLPLSALITWLSACQSSNSSNLAKAEVAVGAMWMFMVVGLSVALVGVFLPWGTCAIGKCLLAGEIYRLGATIYPVTGVALMWGKAVLLCALAGSILLLLPMISQSEKIRPYAVAAWFLATLAVLVMLALQLRNIDSNSTDVMQGFIAAFKASKWLYALSVCLVTGVMIRYRFFGSPTKRAAWIVLTSVVGLALLVLLKFDHTEYDWSSEITTGLPFGFEVGHLTSLVGFATVIVSAIGFLICRRSGRRMKAESHVPVTIQQTSL
jgi:hypothetical protein